MVANDPYELRIIVPVGAKSWRATAVTVSAEDEAAGVKAAFKQDGPKLRATLTSPASREVRWRSGSSPRRSRSPAPPAVTGLKAAADYGGVTLTWADDQADGYRVARNDGTVFDSAVNSFTDATTQQRQHLPLSRAPRSAGTAPFHPPRRWKSRPRSRNVPPTPPAPTIHLAT